MNTPALQARALVLAHLTQHSQEPTALYVGQDDYREMAIEAGDNPHAEFQPGFLHKDWRATFRGVPVYRVDAPRHMRLV